MPEEETIQTIGIGSTDFEPTFLQTTYGTSAFGSYVDELICTTEQSSAEKDKERKARKDLEYQKRKYIDDLRENNDWDKLPFVDREYSNPLWGSSDLSHITDFTDGDYYVSLYSLLSNPMKNSVTLQEFKDSLRLGYNVFKHKLEQSVDSNNVYLFNAEEDTFKRYLVPSKNNTYQFENRLYDISDLPDNFFITGLYNYDSQIIEMSSQVDLSKSKNKIVTILSTVDGIRSRIEREVHRISSENEIFSRRPDTDADDFESDIKGDYVEHDVPFAIELEFYGKDKKAVAKMSHDIDDRWGLCRDGSLNSNIGYPVEIQSPILKGDAGELEVKETCEYLNKNDFSVDKTCGMHVHFSGDTFMTDASDPKKLISLYLFHRLFEPVIVSFLPSTRRNNNYCSQFAKGSSQRGSLYELGTVDDAFSRVVSMSTIADFEKYWYKVESDREVTHKKDERYTESRYMGVNFHSLLKDYHIEIRYHSGTLNYEKILHWVNLHGKIIELCANGSITIEKLFEIKNRGLSFNDLNTVFFEMLNLGVDTVEYLKERQATFAEAETREIDEIVISKTKKLGVI